MYNYILIILYGISDIFSPKKFALLRNLTSIIQKYALLYFQINKPAIYSFNELKISKQRLFIQPQTLQKCLIFLSVQQSIECKKGTSQYYLQVASSLLPTKKIELYISSSNPQLKALFFY